MVMAGVRSRRSASAWVGIAICVLCCSACNADGKTATPSPSVSTSHGVSPTGKSSAGDSTFCKRFIALAKFGQTASAQDADQMVELLEGALQAAPDETVADALRTYLASARRVRDADPDDREAVFDAESLRPDMAEAQSILLGPNISCGLVDPNG